MSKNNQDDLGEKLAALVHNASPNISFRGLEIGAVPIDGHEEPFHQLLRLFPTSEILAFELDEALCASLNEQAISGLKYYPVALGRTEETRTLYETAHPMCSSLYRPNERLISQYDQMDVAALKSTSSVDTVSLDFFVDENNAGPIDFIKIDIQGAELDVFKGGTQTLQDVMMIVTEVEFIPQYVDQPLFGDVCQFLTSQQIMFQRFLNIGRRAMRPFVINDPNKGSHFIWADALFTRDILTLAELPVEKLLKLAVLSLVYGSLDLTYRCLTIADQKQQTDIAQQLIGMTKLGQGGHS